MKITFTRGPKKSLEKGSAQNRNPGEALFPEFHLGTSIFRRQTVIFDLSPIVPMSPKGGYGIEAGVSIYKR
jgi:hypothetical protein